MKSKFVYLVLGVIYIIVLPLKIKSNKITFVSYTSNTLEKDFKLVARELEKNPKYQIQYVLTKFENSLIGNFKYLLNCIIQVYHINTSKVVLLDYNNFVVSHFKKKNVKVVQLWHAPGAIKKFGNDIEREYKIKNYDYAIVASDEWKKPYSTAFSTPIENIKSLGIPTCDYLFSTKKVRKYQKEMKEKIPDIIGKKVVLYAPTFRGNPIYDIKLPKINLSYIQKSLGDDYIVLYKLHPSFYGATITNDTTIINANVFGIKKLLTITDYLISDYSALIFDYAILEKPMLFFTPDKEIYEDERGFYFEYEETMPGPICYHEEQIVTNIIENNFSLEQIKKFKKRFFNYSDSNSTKRTVGFIEELIANKE